jgi:hypothetical protein
MTLAPVPESKLGGLQFIADGGYGEVFRVKNFTLPGDRTELAYKKFSKDHAQQAASAGQAVSFRARLSPADRSDLDCYSVWPRALVEDSPGHVCGLLMPLIPPAFFCQLADPRTGHMKQSPRAMSWLIANEQQRQMTRIDLPQIDQTERLILLAQLVYIIGRLHKHGWVFGDLSFNNAVFALNPPRVMLVDCDGAASLADLGRQQGSTPFWDPPENAGLQDKQTDCYKLGLAILRCLTPGKGASTARKATRLTGELDAAGRSLVDRAVGADRAARPPAREIYHYLKVGVAARIKPPVIHSARLVQAFCLRGQAARVEWSIAGAAEVTVTVGFEPPQVVDPQRYPKGYSLPPDLSGPVVVEAWNRFGQARADLGELTRYEMPAVNITIEALPRLQVAAREAFSPPPLPATVVRRPLVEIGRTDIPRLSPPSVMSLVASAVPGGRDPVHWPSLGPAVSDATDSLTEFIRGAIDEFGPTLRAEFRERAKAEKQPRP